MNRQLALSYAVASVATAIAAIAVVGSALGFAGGDGQEPPPSSEQGVVQEVSDLRESLLAQAVAEVEAQRAEAQAAARAEVESWRARAVAELEQQLAEQFSNAVGAAFVVPIAADGSLYVYAHHEDDEHEVEHEEHEHEEHEHEEHEHGDDD